MLLSVRPPVGVAFSPPPSGPLAPLTRPAAVPETPRRDERDAFACVGAVPRAPPSKSATETDGATAHHIDLILGHGAVSASGELDARHFGATRRSVLSMAETPLARLAHTVPHGACSA